MTRAITTTPRADRPYKVISDFQPAGDQPSAIANLTDRVNRGESDIVLLGATGTGKSATVAWLIEQVQRPTLVLAPNKTLAAQLGASQFDKTDDTVGYGEWGRVELTTLTKEFFMPRFLERDEAMRRRPRGQYAWDGVADVRPFGAMEKKVIEGVY